MNILMGDMSAADAIGLANSSYRSAVSVGNTALAAAAAADSGGSFDWATFLADMIKPANAASAPVAAAAPAPSKTPYYIAAGAALLAIVALK